MNQHPSAADRFALPAGRPANAIHAGTDTDGNELTIPPNGVQTVAVTVEYSDGSHVVYRLPPGTTVEREGAPPSLGALATDVVITTTGRAASPLLDGMTFEQVREYALDEQHRHDPEHQEGNLYGRCAHCDYVRHPCTIHDFASIILAMLAAVGARLAEDADATRPDKEAEHDEDDAEQDRAADELHDADNDEHDGEDPQEEGHD